jgi:hypothetical protein
MRFWEIDTFNPEKPYIFNGVCFDPVRGSGAVPNTGNINYMGFVIFIKPETFRQLTNPIQFERESSGFFEKTLPSGEWCIGPPMLYLSRDNRESNDWYVSGHEGRHRTLALSRLGFDLVPVYIFPQYLRSRDVNEELLKDINLLRNESDTDWVFLQPKFLIVDQKVIVRISDLLVHEYPSLLEREATEWRAIKPKHVITEPQKLVIDAEQDFYYDWSRPIHDRQSDLT